MPIGEPCSAEPCPGRLSVRDGKLPNGCGSSRFPGYGRFVPGGLLTKGPEVCRILSCWVVSSEEERFLDAEDCILLGVSALCRDALFLVFIGIREFSGITRLSFLLALYPFPIKKTTFSKYNLKVNPGAYI